MQWANSPGQRTIVIGFAMRYKNGWSMSEALLRVDDLKVHFPERAGFFSGPTGVVKAVEGVIIAEFIASNKGLGFMIVRASAFMDMTLMFSGLVAAAIVALIFNGAMSMIGQWLMPWSRH